MPRPSLKPSLSPSPGAIVWSDLRKTRPYPTTQRFDDSEVKAARERIARLRRYGIEEGDLPEEERIARRAARQAAVKAELDRQARRKRIIDDTRTVTQFIVVTGLLIGFVITVIASL